MCSACCVMAAADLLLFTFLKVQLTYHAKPDTQESLSSLYSSFGASQGAKDDPLPLITLAKHGPT